MNIKTFAIAMAGTIMLGSCQVSDNQKKKTWKHLH